MFDLLMHTLHHLFHSWVTKKCSSRTVNQRCWGSPHGCSIASIFDLVLPNEPRYTVFPHKELPRICEWRDMGRRIQWPDPSGSHYFTQVPSIVTFSQRKYLKPFQNTRVSTGKNIENMANKKSEAEIAPNFQQICSSQLLKAAFPGLNRTTCKG